MADVEALIVSVETGFETVNAEKGALTLPADIQALEPINISITDTNSRLDNKLIVPSASIDINTSYGAGLLEKQNNNSLNIYVKNGTDTVIEDTYLAKHFNISDGNWNDIPIIASSSENITIANGADIVIEDTLTTTSIISDGYDSLGGYDFFQSHGDNVTWNIGYGGFTGLNSGTPVTPATASNVLGSNINNLFAAYDGSTFSGTTWSDDINTYDTNNSTGSPAISSSQLNGYDIVEGNTSAGLKWPTGILPSNYTLFHVTRYNGSTKRRIFSASNTNWLSGFHSGKAGVAYHNAWVGPQTDYHGTDWVISTDQRYLYRSNGVTRGTNGSSEGDLTINMGQYSETSDWQCAEVIIFDRQLTQSEYEDVEEYLSKKYNIPLNGAVATSWPFGGIYGSGGISYNSTQTSSITYDSAIGDITININDFPKTNIITSKNFSALSNSTYSFKEASARTIENTNTIRDSNYKTTNIVTSKDFSAFSNSSYNPIDADFYTSLDSDELRELKVLGKTINTSGDLSSRSPLFIDAVQKFFYTNNAVGLGYFEVDGVARISDINQNNDPRLIGGTVAAAGGGGGDSASGVAGPVQAWSS
jgi:hypothetical protein